VAETIPDLRALPKREAYDRLITDVGLVLDGVRDPVAAMATMSAFLYHGFGLLWAGFYRVVAPELLLVGPYQGSLGCLEIPFARGVCGAAARERRTMIVADVQAFPGHITCDARSRSEIVVPVVDGAGQLIAVLDIDAEQPSAFDEHDREGLERLVAWFARAGSADYSIGSRGGASVVPADPGSTSSGTMIIGYSDRINHALAFAAKHHDQQVRKGTRLPYLTQSPNVAIILTRYGQPEDTVVAGILHDVVDDVGRDGMTHEMLTQRIAEKFGDRVLATVNAVTQRQLDDDGVELSTDERRDDYLERLATADESARWVCAAAQVHTGSSLLAELRRTDFPETVWGRFAAGQEGTIRWYRRTHDRLAALGFDAPIMGELGTVADELERYMPEESEIRRR
jgi:GAF domain-containing protein